MKIIHMENIVEYATTHLTAKGYVPGQKELEDVIDVVFMFLEEQGMVDYIPFPEGDEK